MTELVKINFCQMKVYNIFLSLILPFFSFLSSYSQTPEQISGMSKHQLYEYRKIFLKNFDRLYINTTNEDAKLLNLLIKMGKLSRGIEIGSANGFGAIYMGMAFEQNEGQLYTIEIDPKMVDACRNNINKTGLKETVTCLKGDALKVIPGLEGKFDFVFIDAQKSDYLKYFKAVEEKLADQAIIIADNVIKYENAMRGFLEEMQSRDNFEMVVIQASNAKEDGMAIIYKNNF
jgi:predicted O-methyltransferase YrrM